jgi:uncharacterized membrane protein YhhN
MHFKECLKWIGTAVFFAAAILLALNIEISKLGFILFLIGHIIFAYVFIKDKAMLIQNLGFLVLDLVAIYRWFLV